MTITGDYMPQRILMVNGWDPHWKQIPMGTFGLCDFLYQKGIESKIFNAALYAENEYLDKLKETIVNFKPAYVGITLHWKELFENFIFLSREIKKFFPDIKILTGGMTAGFWNGELLKKFSSIDFVIKGDPEEPIYLLMTKVSVDRIPNLSYREKGAIKTCKEVYIIDKNTLDKISCAKLEYLIDFDRYIEQIKGSFGFPIFIGRGCFYDCLYCGGSKRAFRLHSNRKAVIERDIKRVILDLRLLLKHTDTIFISYEVNRPYIHNLFKAVAYDKQIAKKFRLNYSAWHLPDASFLDLYAKAFKFGWHARPTISISPETSFDNDRRIIKDKSMHFTNMEMFQAVKSIQNKFGDAVKIQINYSRYHKTHNTIEKLVLELRNIHNYTYGNYIKGVTNIEVCYKHLSTDMGSLYWDLIFKDKQVPDEMASLLDMISKRKNNFSGKDEYQLDNLCLYSPKELTKDNKFKYECLISKLLYGTSACYQ